MRVVGLCCVFVLWCETARYAAHNPSYHSPQIISAGVSVSASAVYIDISVNYRNTAVLSGARLL